MIIGRDATFGLPDTSERSKGGEREGQGAGSWPFPVLVQYLPSAPTALQVNLLFPKFEPVTSILCSVSLTKRGSNAAEAILVESKLQHFPLRAKPSPCLAHEHAWVCLELEADDHAAGHPHP